jgi:long-chain acyl-CoA synthetase
LAVAKQSEAISLVEIAAEVPGRIHQVLEPHVSGTPDRVALIEEGTSWTYGELDRSVADIAAALRSLGIRAGDRMIIVSENCIALVALLLAASRIDAWAIVANPRLSPRELDLIRDHSGARRMFLTVAVSKEAEAHAQRYGAGIGPLGPLKEVGVSALNEATDAEAVEKDPAKQVAVREPRVRPKA